MNFSSSPYIRSLVLVGMLLVMHMCCQAQTNGLYVPDSARIFLSAGSTAGIWGDTLQLNGRLQMQDSTAAVAFKGNVWRNGSTGKINSGKVMMNGSSRQSIMGAADYSDSSVAFARLEINNPAGVGLKSSSIKIDSLIMFTKGVLATGSNDLMLGRQIHVTQTDASSFAAVDSGGGLSKFFSSNAAFNFPVGTNEGSAISNPIQIALNATGYNSLSYVRVGISDTVHPNKTPRHMNYASKSWSVKFRNMTVDSASYLATYNPADPFTGNKNKITGSVWANGRWTYLASSALPGQATIISGKLPSDGDIFAQDKLIAADVKVVLQGPWNGSSMNTTLRNLNVIPETQPYGAAPYNVAAFNYTGTEARTSIPANAVDWVLLELRSTPTGAAVARSAGILLSNGNVVDGFSDGPVEFENINEGNYYVIVKHRNHLGIMSAAPVSLPNALAYDFTTGINKVYGTTATRLVLLTGGKYGMHGGNVIPDLRVLGTGLAALNDAAKIAFIANSGINLTNIYNQGDVNLNGIVRALGLNTVNDRAKVLQVFLGATGTNFTQTF